MKHGLFLCLAAIAVGSSDTHSIAGAADSEPPICALARQSGTPQIPGLTVVYLSPLSEPTAANAWENIIIHRMEGPSGAAKNGALAQAKDPTRRGVTL